MAHSFVIELGIYSVTEIVSRKVVGIHSTKIFFLQLKEKMGHRATLAYIRPNFFDPGK